MKSASLWLQRAAASAGVALAAGCGGGGTEPPPPPPPSVAQVVITSPTAAVTFATLGRTLQFAAEPRDASGNVVPGKTLTWSSSNAAVASVISSSGLVTAVGNGPATISASVDGKTGPLGVTVAQVTNSVVVTPSTAAFGAKGSTSQLTAQARDSTNNAIAGKTFTWSSSSTAVATVDAAGLVTAVADGTTQVSATVDGKSDSTTVTVAIVTATVAVTPGTKTFGAAGGTQQFTAQAADSNGNVVAGRTFAWSSSNTAVVTVDASSALATSVANGTAQIQATADGKTGSASITVDIVIATLTLSPTTRTFTRISQTQAFTPTARDSNNNVITSPGVTWTSRNTAFVTVNASGVTTSVADGATYVVATSTSSGAKDSAQVTVAAVANSVTISPTSVAFGAIGSTRQLTASVLDSGNTAIPGRTVTWSNETNTGAATVNASGLVTSAGVGSETLRASATGPVGPVTVDVAVTVTQVVKTVTVSSARTTLFKASDTLTFTAAATDSFSNAIAGRVFTWASTLTGVATVGASTGIATAGTSNGTTSIQATTGTVTGSKNLTVNRLVASVTVQSPGARINDTLTTFTGTLVYTGTALDSGGTAIASTSFTWTTTNSRIASISPASGTTTTATVAGEGTATITGTASGKAAQTTLVMQLPPVSFPTDVQSIFTTSCAKSLCHDAATAQGGLNLTASAYIRIVNQPPSASQPYIKPNDPANSMIILRTEGTISPRMPEDGPPFLTSAQMALIRTWITRGALNN